MKFSIQDFFSKCDQIRSFLRIWSHLLKKPLMENLTFCAVLSPHMRIRYLAHSHLSLQLLLKTSFDVRKYGLEVWVAFPWHETSSFLAIAEAW